MHWSISWYRFTFFRNIHTPHTSPNTCRNESSMNSKYTHKSNYDIISSILPRVSSPPKDSLRTCISIVQHPFCCLDGHKRSNVSFIYSHTSEVGVDVAGSRSSITRVPIHAVNLPESCIDRSTRVFVAGVRITSAFMSNNTLAAGLRPAGVFLAGGVDIHWICSSTRIAVRLLLDGPSNTDYCQKEHDSTLHHKFTTHTNSNRIDTKTAAVVLCLPAGGGQWWPVTGQWGSVMVEWWTNVQWCLYRYRTRCAVLAVC